MPVIVTSENEHPFLPSLAGNRAIDSERARHQDVRPLEILVVNLMAEKERTEMELARWLGKTPLQVHVTFAATDTYIDDVRTGARTPGNTPVEHIEKFYNRFRDVKNKKFDGIIITGVNAKEQDPTREKFWPEVREILDWSTTHATSSLYLCWGAQAALKHFHGIDRKPSAQKTYGVFDHRIAEDRSGILNGFADVFPVPVSRWNEIPAAAVREKTALEIISVSDKAGVGLIAEVSSYDDGTKHYPKRLYSLFHPEYSTESLKQEYDRDSAKRADFPLPHGYFPANDPKAVPQNTWRHTGEFYANWINLVYEATQFDLNQVPQPFRRLAAVPPPRRQDPK